MNTIIERFNKIKSNIILGKPTQKVNIIAVSKTFPLEHLNPLIDYGHLHFGENKVQEATAKWSSIKKNKNINLHMVGKLQTNKAKDAVKLFDNNPEKYFKTLNEMNKSLGLQDLSMGMSADYMKAIDHGATFVRVGSSIFGERF